MTLLVTNYFYPWNTSGAFRWVHIGEHMDFDVLTCKKPRGAMYDTTMPGSNHRVFRHGSNLPAVLFGLYITFFVIYLRKRYDKIIFSCPPESLLIPAWICQKLGSKVYVDLRDHINRGNNTNKWRGLAWLWRLFYNKLKNRVAVNEVIEEYDHIIRHGYMDLGKVRKNWEFIPYRRYSYYEFTQYLRWGFILDYRERPKDRTPSTFYTYRKYFKDLPKHFSDKRMYSWPLFSYKQIAGQWEEYLDR